MASKARGINYLDRQSSSLKLVQPSKVPNSQLLSNKSKLNADQSEALEISKYIIEKVLLPRILGRAATKKKKDAPKPATVPAATPMQPPKQTAADSRKNDAKTLPAGPKPKRIFGVKKKPPIVTEPTHKDQFTMTDDLKENVKTKPTNRSLKVKPKSATTKTKKSIAVLNDNKDRIETVSEANIEEITGKSGDLTAADIQGGGTGDGNLIISEITVKFCRRH